MQRLNLKVISQEREVSKHAALPAAPVSDVAIDPGQMDGLPMVDLKA